jgi:hypothetical protein
MEKFAKAFCHFLHCQIATHIPSAKDTCFYRGVLSLADAGGIRLANQMSGINNTQGSLRYLSSASSERDVICRYGWKLNRLRRRLARLAPSV